ncbi:hypothetical protein MF271_20265 (plasmid) [Deinococcus sp. KNUC1210]|uniref:alginate O-acetyltransferase AlgX-related protein n=1 Tax=Deinococcus sp. KNUC1210 TaxID=2917691 RepID=UPI001EF0E345|nr:hypothetical protein [Deinococcus sp. KNUC1210]ULH17744.1 hypothetical protein MF271_20265 [Deinococcus sp. KNUC1210]
MSLPVRLSAIVFTFLASSAAAQAVTPDCAVKLDKQAWMFAGQNAHYYYGDELSGRWMNQPWADAFKFVPRFAEVSAALKARGTTLVLAPVPPRTFLKGAALDTGNPTQKAFDPAAARTFYLKLVQSLAGAGVPTADLLTGADAADTFPKDIHWTPQGAANAAKVVAGVVRGLPAFASLPREEFQTLSTGSAIRYVTDQPIIAKVKELCGSDLTPDQYESETTVPTTGLPAAVGNFGDPEKNMQRWAFGPTSTLSFALPSAAPVTLHLAFYSPVAAQSVALTLNGAALDTLGPVAKGSVTDKTYTLPGVAGANRLDLKFSDWNGHTTTFAPGDARPMAVAVKTLTLTAGTLQADLVSPATDPSALLGAQTPGVALVGASSSMALLNFDGALKQALGTDVQNVSYGAAGVFNSLKDYLRDPAFQQAPPKVLVWQFPMIGGDATTDADFRDVLAAVQGPCQGAAPFTASGSAGTLTIAGTSIPAGARLHVWADDKTFQTLNVKAAGLDLHLANSPRMLQQGEFYAALDVAAGTPLQLSWAAGIKGQVQAEVCAAR